MRKDSSCKENVLSRKEKTERQNQNKTPAPTKRSRGLPCRLRDEEVVLEMNTREKEKVLGTD